MKNLASRSVTSSSAKCQNDTNTKLTLHSPEVDCLEDHPGVKGVNLRIETEVTDPAQKNNKFRNVCTPEQNPPSFSNSIQFKLLEKSDDPVVIKKKVLQIQKATKLELYGLAPDVAPLTSPIPSSVRQAFKPPTQTLDTPPTARTTSSLGSSTPVSNKRTPITDQPTPVTSRSVTSINICRSIRNKRLGASRVRIDAAVSTCNTTADTCNGTPVTTADVPDLTCTETSSTTSDNKHQMSAVEQTDNDVATYGQNEECELPVSDRGTVSTTDLTSSKGRRKKNTNLSVDAAEAAEQRRKSLRLRKT